MKQLSVNQIWQLNESTEYRILYFLKKSEEIIWIDINNAKSLPESIDMDEFDHFYKSGCLIDKSTVENFGNPELLRPASREKWANYCKIIDMVSGEEPEIYLKTFFNAKCKEIAQKLGMDIMKPRRVILKYWKGGKNKLALIPKLSNSGAKGKERKPSLLKRGRPNLYTKTQINVDTKLKRALEAGYNKFYLKTAQASLTTAYENFISTSYYDKVKSDLISDIPSITQFRYWGEKKYGADERKRLKVGVKNFNKDFRIITDSSNVNVTGPGSLYQIDSTPADVELVSSIDRSICIGSPTLYFVADVFSRMIVGVLVTLDEPSYYTASRAIYNTIIDKNQFFEQEGLAKVSELNISHDDWPCNFIPDAIVADRAELLGHQSNNIINDLGITIENTAAYRADLKGIVENHFNTLHKRIRGLKANIGMKSTNHKERGVRDARLDAVLTLKEYYCLILSEVINYNNSKPLKNYPLTAHMIQDIPSATPIKLWKWGIENASGQLRSNNISNLKQRLLPREKGKFNKEGLRFKNLFYNFSDSSSIREQQILLQSKSKIVDVLYDPFDLRLVHIYYDSEILECTLSSRNPLALTLNIWELHAHELNTKRSLYEDQDKHLQKTGDSMKFMTGIIEGAQKEKRKKTSSSIKAQEIRGNRKKEKAQIIQSKSFDEPVDPSSKKGKIVPLVPKEPLQSGKKTKNDFYKRLMRGDNE